jgi:hypothetical protein
MSSQAAVLLSFLFFVHFLGDFTPLATESMQEAKRAGRPLGPIALHALVHAALVGLVVALVARPAPILVLAAATIEFWTHLFLDWWKGFMSARRPVLGDPGRKGFWTALGLDQLAHALVLVWVAWMVLL